MKNRLLKTTDLTHFCDINQSIRLFSKASNEHIHRVAFDAAGKLDFRT